MREILLLKPQMKTWLNLQYFIKKGYGLSNKKQTDFESKQQGLASPMRFALDLLWVPFAASMAMDTVFFSCKCLKSCKGCAAACQTDVFMARNGSCRCTAWQWQSCAVANHTWRSPVPGWWPGTSSGHLSPETYPGNIMGSAVWHIHKHFEGINQQF